MRTPILSGRSTPFSVKHSPPKLQETLQALEREQSVMNRLGTLKRLIEIIGEASPKLPRPACIHVARFLINHGLALRDDRDDRLHYDAKNGEALLKASGKRGQFALPDLSNRAAIRARIDGIIEPPEPVAPPVPMPLAMTLDAFGALVWKHVVDRTICVAGVLHRLHVPRSRSKWLKAWNVTEPERFLEMFEAFITSGMLTSVGGSAGEDLTYALPADPKTIEVTILEAEQPKIVPPQPAPEPEPVKAPEPESIPTLVISKTPEIVKPPEAPPSPVPEKKTASRRRSKKPAYGPLPPDLTLAKEEHLRLYLNVYRAQGEAFADKAAAIEAELERRLKAA